MAKKIINIGQTPNDKSGDPLRTAFDKVNQNFTELYNMTGAGSISVSIDTTAPVAPVEGGLWWNSSDGKTYVYYNDAWVDTSSPAGNVSVDRLTNTGKELVLNVDGDRSWLDFPASFGESISVQGTEIGTLSSLVLSGNERVTLSTNLSSSNRLVWTFDTAGTMTAPHLFPISFTAVLDSDHMVNAVGFAGMTPLWEFDVQFQVNPDGNIQTILDDIFPILGNPGYVSGYTFRYTEADHGIPGYTFDIVLQNVVNAGPAGWTANPAVTPAPAYPPTIDSEGAIKLTSNGNSLVLGTDGAVTASGNIIPDLDLQYNLGSPTNKWHSLYVGTGSIYVGDAVISLNNGKLESSVGFAGSLTTSKTTSGVVGFVADGSTVTTYTFPTQAFGPYNFATLEASESGDYVEHVPATYSYTLDNDGYISSVTLETPGSGYPAQSQESRIITFNVINSQLEPVRLTDVAGINLYDVSDWTNGTYTASAVIGGQTVTVTYTVSDMQNPTQYANKEVVANSFTSTGLLDAGTISVFTGLYVAKNDPTTINTSETFNDDVRFFFSSQLAELPVFEYVVETTVTQAEFNGSYNDLLNTPTIPTDVADLTDTGNLLGGGNPFDQSLNSSDDVNFATVAFPESGLGAPTVSTRSPGTKLIIWPEVNVSGHADYAIGMADSVLWQTVPTPGQSFKWYGGDELALTLSGTGVLTTKGAVVLSVTNIADLETAYQNSIVTLDDLFAADSYTGAGYPASIDSYDLLVRAQALNPLLPSIYLVAAANLRNNYYDWVNSKTTIQTDGSGFVITNPAGNGWQFREDTGMRFPDNTYQTTAFTGLQTSLVANNNLYFEIDGGGSNTNAAIKWISDSNEKAILNYNPDGYFVLATNYDAVGQEKYWKFDDDGVLTMPLNKDTLLNYGELYFGDYGAGSKMFIDQYYNLQIYTNTGGQRTGNWIFGTNGNFITPGDIYGKSGDDYKGLVFSDNGFNDKGHIKVDTGENMVVVANSNFYVKLGGSDRLSITNTNTTLSAANNVVINPNNSSNTWTFGTTGNITFPDTTVQSTAYQTAAAPTTSKGVSGNKAGMVAFDSVNFYYCKTNYTDGVADIWVKTAWTSTSW